MSNVVSPALGAPRRKLSGNAAGCLWMVASTLLFVAVDAIIKELTGHLHPFVIGFLRNALAVGLFLPLAARNNWQLLRTTKLRLHLMRGFLGLLGTVLYFYSLSVQPLASATAFQFLAPIFAIILAVVFFKEKLATVRILAIGLAVAGVLLVTKPSGQLLSFGAVLGIAAAFIQSLIFLVVKQMTNTEPAFRITILMNWTISFLSLPLAIWAWSTPSVFDWVCLAALAALASAGQYCVARALSSGDANVVAPLEYTKLIWAAGVGVAIFGEPLSMTILLGGAAIIVSSFVLALKGGTR